MSNFQVYSLAEFENWLSVQKVSRLIKLVQNHHTWKPNYHSFKQADAKALLKSMEMAHLERGFNAIAQHFTTFPDGTIGSGRSLDTIPAGIKGANRNGICIEHVGNFDIGGDKMNDIHKETIVRINALLCAKFGLIPSEESIVYHHWYDLNTGDRTNGSGTTKTCPGTNFFGGNTVQNFRTNFLPLVVKETKKVSTGNIPKRFLFTGRVNAQSLNVRNAGSTKAPILAKLSKGTEIRVFSEKSGWYSIDSDFSRWVKKEFVNVPA